MMPKKNQQQEPAVVGYQEPEVETGPVDWDDPWYRGQVVAQMFGLPPLKKQPYTPKGGDMTPEELVEFVPKMERLVVESRDWPLPWTDEWKKMYLVRGGK